MIIMLVFFLLLLWLLILFPAYSLAIVHIAMFILCTYVCTQLLYTVTYTKYLDSKSVHYIYICPGMYAYICIYICIHAYVCLSHAGAFKNAWTRPGFRFKVFRF